MLKFTIDEAHKLGMGVDIPPDAGWACGGPFVPEEKGLLKLNISSIEVKANERWRLSNEITYTIASSFFNKNGQVIVLKSGEQFLSK